ncbi:MAG: hypothetical protein IOC82_07425 [Aestuariivirga sp.]|uniref:hypothetical protein n=1 Tax=Aestuariivirga sp. TaxID=2650926 RepID=UPI0025B881D2|nr:hypothetical protein [Aestuariivirga sp.]MCA3560845.1 hypothetical protein [Aestuariivirga sp.]
MTDRPIAVAHHNRSPDQSVRLVIAATVLLVYAAIMIDRRENTLGEGDLFWHIKTGLWMLQHRAVPSTDMYSYTFAGHPWMAKEWLSQLIYAAIFQLGGWNAVVTAAVVSVGAAAALLYWSLSASLRPPLAGSIALAALLATSITFTIRPHLLTLPLLVIWTHFLFKWSSTARAPSFLLLPVIVVWANLHAAFTMGFVIAFFAFLDFLENGGWAKKKALWTWLAFLALCPAVTLLHPYSYRAMMATLWVFRPSEGTLMVLEWMPFNAQEDIIHAALIFGSIFAALASGFRLGWARAFFVTFLCYQYMAHVRYAFFFFPVLALVTAPAIARQFHRLSAEYWRSERREGLERRMHDAFRPIMTGLCGAIAVLLGLQLWVLKSAPPEKVSVNTAIAYAKSFGLSGHVFNHYNLGGSLIFHDIPTFIDGRSDQLFVGEISKAFEASEKDEKSLVDVLQKYDMRWTLFPPADPRTKMLDKLPGWTRVFADKNAVIHQRTDMPRE